MRHVGAGQCVVSTVCMASHGNVHQTCRSCLRTFLDHDNINACQSFQCDLRTTALRAPPAFSMSMITFDEYGRPFIILREQEKKQRIRGIEAQKSNIQAAKTISRMLQSSLGPKGMDKMLQSGDGDVTISECPSLHQVNLLIIGTLQIKDVYTVQRMMALPSWSRWRWKIRSEGF